VLVQLGNWPGTLIQGWGPAHFLAVK